jgi:DNA-binding MarR family transcriptional regulator
MIILVAKAITLEVFLMDTSNKNVLHNIGRHLFITEKYFKLFLKYELKPYEITASECMVLLMIAEHCVDSMQDGISQEQINEELNYDKGVLTRLMKGLEEKDLVKREANPKDGRSYLFVPTEKMLSYKPYIRNALKKWSEIVFESVDEEHVCSFADNLQSMSEKAKKAASQAKNNQDK